VTDKKALVPVQHEVVSIVQNQIKITEKIITSLVHNTCENNKYGISCLTDIRKAAELGDVNAQCNLGKMYRCGEGVPQDDAEAVKWYRKAAEQEHKGAQHELDMLNQKDKVVSEDDEDIQLLEKEFNDIYCAIQQMLQYRCDDKIENFKKEYEEAYLAFSKLASGYNSDNDEYLKDFSEDFGIVYPALKKMVERAQIETDPELIYFKEDYDTIYISIQKILYGIEDEELDEFKEDFDIVYWALEEVLAGKDESTSDFLKEFSEEFDVVCHAMKKMVARAKDVNILPVWERAYHKVIPPDESNSVRLYRKAAEQGNVNAQFWLGLMYRCGKGVQKDDVEAAKWFCMAAEQGQADLELHDCFKSKNSQPTNVQSDEKQPKKLTPEKLKKVVEILTPHLVAHLKRKGILPKDK
jgi:TPR repeat protein